MDDYIGWLLDLTYWHWLAIAVVLGGVEMLSMSFFLIFPTISAVLVAGALYVDPAIDWRIQLLIFAAFSIVTTILGRRWMKRFRDSSGPQTVNNRGQNFAGRRVRLREALEHGEGRIQIDDIWWSAVSKKRETVAANVLVEITGSDGATLQIRVLEE